MRFGQEIFIKNYIYICFRRDKLIETKFLIEYNRTSFSLFNNNLDNLLSLYSVYVYWKISRSMDQIRREKNERNSAILIVDIYIYNKTIKLFVYLHGFDALQRVFDRNNREISVTDLIATGVFRSKGKFNYLMKFLSRKRKKEEKKKKRKTIGYAAISVYFPLYIFHIR